jgi:cytosine deaminase
MENSGFSLLLLLCTKWMRGNVYGLGEKRHIHGVIKMTAVPLWLIENVRLPDREGLWQIAIDKGCFGDITPMGDARSESYEVLNARGGLAIPPFIEPHIHLDTTQTAGEPNWNQSGTLFEGIERWAERKALLSHEDVKARAWKTLKWQIANGIQFVRTHVDVSDPTLTALKAMLEVKQEVAPWVDLQIVAFPQEGILSYPNGEAAAGGGPAAGGRCGRRHSAL